MNVGVIGAGAMGSLIGGRIALHTDATVTLIDVWKDHVEKIRRDGLDLTDDSGKHIIKVQISYPEEIKEAFDFVVVFTKTTHAEAALKNASAAIGPKTVVLTMQNGLGNIERIEKYVPREQIIAAVTTENGNLIGPGTVESHGKGLTKVMTASGKKTPELDTVVNLLEKAGFPMQVTPDVFVSIWEKVAFNAAFNSLCGILYLDCGGLGATEEGRELAMLCAEEGCAVARAAGVEADTERVKNMIKNSFVQHARHLPSMLQDIIAGKQTEIDSINGEIAKTGDAHGIPTPTIRTLWKLVKAYELTRNERIKS